MDRVEPISHCSYCCFVTTHSNLTFELPNSKQLHVARKYTIRNLSSKTAFILINNLFNVKTQKNYGAPPPSHRAIEASKVLLATSAGVFSSCNLPNLNTAMKPPNFAPLESSNSMNSTFEFDLPKVQQNWTFIKSHAIHP